MSEDDPPELRRSMERAGLSGVRRLATFGPEGLRVHVTPPGLSPAMRGALGSLPPRQKLALELHHGLRDGRPWSYLEIARKLGITTDHARRTIENGRARLRWFVGE